MALGLEILTLHYRVKKRYTFFCCQFQTKTLIVSSTTKPNTPHKGKKKKKNPQLELLGDEET